MVSYCIPCLFDKCGLLLLLSEKQYLVIYTKLDLYWTNIEEVR